MVSSTCELYYMVWLVQRTTNTHGILKLKFQVPRIKKFPDQIRNSQLKVFFHQCWRREKSQICLIPDDMVLQLSTHYQRNPPHKTVCLYDITCHFLHLLHSTWGQPAEWATLPWQIKPTGSGNWEQRWRRSSHYNLLRRNRRGVEVQLLLTYLLTPWSRVLFEKLTGSAASQEIPRIFGTRRFLTVLTSAHHLSLSWANSVQSPQPPPTSWRSTLILSSHLCLGLPNGLFSSGFPTRTLCTPLPSPICAT